MKTYLQQLLGPQGGYRFEVDLEGRALPSLPWAAGGGPEGGFCWGGGVTFFSLSWIRSDPTPGDTVRNVRSFGRRLGFFGALWRFGVGRRY